MHGIGGGSMAIDNLWDKTALYVPLTGRDSTTDFVEYQRNVSSFRPSSYGVSLSTASSPIGLGSSLFCPNSTAGFAAFTFEYVVGLSDFSIEMWFNPSSGGHGQAGSRLLTIGDGGSAVGELGITAYASTNPMTLLFEWSSSSGVLTPLLTYDSTTFANGSWHWLLLRRVSGVWTAHVNNVLYGTSSEAANISSSAKRVCIGGTHYNNRTFYGYIGPTRITLGSARTDPTIPTSLYPRPQIKGAVFDSIGNPVSKTIFCNDRESGLVSASDVSSAITGEYTLFPSSFSEQSVTRLDETSDPLWGGVIFAARLTGSNGGTSFPTLKNTAGQEVIITGSVVTSTSAPSTNPFGTGSSAKFSSGGFLKWLSSGTDFTCMTSSTLDITISGWMYVVNTGGYHGIFILGDEALTNLPKTELTINSSGNVILESNDSGSSASTSSSTIPWSTWINFAVVKFLNRETIAFIDGVKFCSVNRASLNSGTKFSLGISRYTGTQRFLTGNLCDVRITKTIDRSCMYPPVAVPFLAGPSVSGTGENALIIDRVTPGY